MKIFGTNFFGHDSSVFYLDTDEKKIFVISTKDFIDCNLDELYIGDYLVIPVSRSIIKGNIRHSKG